MMRDDPDAVLFIPVLEWTPVIDIQGEDFVLTDITKTMGMRLETGFKDRNRATPTAIPFNCDVLSDDALRYMIFSNLRSGCPLRFGSWHSYISAIILTWTKVLVNQHR